MLGFITRIFAKSYQKALGKRLQTYGLKYEDLLVETADVQTAISRTNRSVILDRERRITRAFDASAKKKTIPQELHNYDVFEQYLSKNVAVANAERLERAALNH